MSALLTKKCSKCGEVKSLSSYYTNSNKCKSCTCEAVKTNRNKNIEKVKEYDRFRHKKINMSEEAWTEKLSRGLKQNCSKDEWERKLEISRSSAALHAVKRRETTRKYRERNPKKRKAHVKVGNAVRDGKLIPQPCEICQSLEVHGHHCDYDKPYEVLWLCSEHHIAWHTKNGEGLNAH